MSSPARNTENKLYEVWELQQFEHELFTVSGEKVIVYDKGERFNDLAGPDYKNARIKIGNFNLAGDIEIDKEFSNWKTHGHNINSKYNGVILHICLYNKLNQSYVYSKEGRKIPTLCLSSYLKDEKIKQLTEETSEKDNGNLVFKCSDYGINIPVKTKENILKENGISRYNKKCKRLFERLKELTFIKELKINEPKISYDLNENFNKKNFTADDFKDSIIWQQLIYEMLFEALGYSQNKNPMMKLAQFVNLEFMKKFCHENDFLNIIESTLFNVAGIIPKKLTNNEEIDNYINEINSYWENIKRIYDGEQINEIEWYFFKLRPQNFPTIRIAGGTRLVKMILDENDLVSKMIKVFSEVNNPKVLINILRSMFVVKSEGFWKNHYAFNQPANTEINFFVGISRADEILANVVFPFLSVYFDVFGKKDLSRKVLQIYGMFEQKTENKIVHDVSQTLGLEFLAKKTLYSQGMIELFRSYCSKNKCLECEIGKIVF